MITPDVRSHLIALAEEAGRAIMAVHASGDFGVEAKSDHSPLTRADQASHKVLMKLEGYLGLPLISEEGNLPPFEMRSVWPAFWLIDPLDGTKEFIQQNGEFTVNIALIQGGRSVYGVVHVPATGQTYVGGSGKETLRLGPDRQERIRVSTPHDGPLRVVASRSHMSPETQEFIDGLGNCEVVSAGSSLKFCRVAEGSADVYPRLGPTMEWDTAAAQAVVEGAGGHVLAGNKPLRYNREDMLNPHFLAAPDWVLQRFPARVGV